MKPYDQINWKSVIRWSTFIFLTIVFAGFFLVKPIMHLEQELGFAFCNPTLWLLDLEELMWNVPTEFNTHQNKDMLTFSGFMCCMLSFAVHIILFILGIMGLCHLRERAIKGK